MFISAENIIKAMSFISSIASMDKNQPGIAFDIGDDSIVVNYSSNDKAIVYTIPADIEDSDIKGKVIFDYQRMIDTMNTAKPSGIIKTNDIEIKLSTRADGSGIADIKIVKAIETPNEDSDTNTSRIVSVNNHQLGWWNESNATIKQKVLTKPICDNMFNEDQAETWDREDFINTLNSVNYGDAKVVYMYPSIHGAFESNTNSLVYAKSNHYPEKMLILNTAIIPALSTVFNESEEIMVNTIENNGSTYAFIFFTPDHKASIYSKAGNKSQTHNARMKQFGGMKYQDIQASFITDVIKDILKSAVSINTAANAEIKFIRTEDEVDMVITAENSGASVNNSYNIKCTAFNTKMADDENSDKIMSFTVNLKQFYDEVSKNKENYTALDFFVGPDRTFVRIGFFDIEDANKVRVRKLEEKKNESENPDEVTNKLTQDDKMEMRDEYIKTFIYIVTT